MYFVLFGPETGSPLPVLQITSFIIFLAKNKKINDCRSVRPWAEDDLFLDFNLQPERAVHWKEAGVESWRPGFSVI